jgi:hypothetical protein
MNEVGQGFERIIAVLRKLGIPYAVGGSLASSVHGIPRATVDIDFVVEVKPSQVDGLIAELQKGFYADADMIRAAVDSKRSFNLIELETSYKFDLFPLPDGPYFRTELDRRENAQHPFGDKLIEFSVVSPEDVILTKLIWFRADGGVSDRQWNDVRGILEVQGDRLDRDYLLRWARELDVVDLVEQLLSGEARDELPQPC